MKIKELRKKAINNVLGLDAKIPHRTAARMLVDSYPDLFSNINTARDAIRYATGNKGEFCRRNVKTSEHFRTGYVGSNLKLKTQADVEKVELQLRGAENEIAQLTKTIQQFGAQRRQYVLDPHSHGNTIRFGMVSDTHWGSLYERLDAFIEFMRMCEREGIKDIYHTGDMLDGHGIYKGQVFEQYAIGLDEQKKVFEKKVPAFKGQNIYFITGNHDLSFKKLVGLSIGNYVESVKPNWHYLGDEYALVQMRTKSGRSFALSLVHPGGGTAYAVSYHPQKHVESLPGGQKPDCVFIGHYHKAIWLPTYRNVDAFCGGCFQSQTPFMAGRNIAAMVGGWTVEATVTPRGSLTRSVRAEFHSFFEPKV